MLNRRDVLKAGAGAVAVAGVASLAGASRAFADSHGAGPKHAALIAAVDDCVTAGEACVQHCLTQYAKGDDSLATCAQTVNDMLAVCRGVGPLAHAESAHLAAYVKVCVAVCTDCEKACREHAGHHAECKACADACAAMIKAAGSLAA